MFLKQKAIYLSKREKRGQDCPGTSNYNRPQTIY